METAGNPLQALLLLWRTTQVWPRSLRRLSLHWRALSPKIQEAWRPTFPNPQLASFSLPDEQDYSEVTSLVSAYIPFQGAILGLLNLQTVYSLSVEGTSLTTVTVINFPPTDLIRGEILTEEANVKANISLNPSHILSVGGEK